MVPSGSRFAPDSTPILVFVCVLSLCLGPLWLPLFDLDEGAFAEATREMLASGNFAATWLDGEPRYDKPILSYWLQAASVHLLGPEPFAFRLPSLLASGLWLLVLYRFAAQAFGRSTAAAAVLITSQCLVFSLIAKAATADALLNLFITLAVTDVWRHGRCLRSGDAAGARALVRRIPVWLALGFLTKGPVAVVVPLMPGFLWYLGLGRIGAFFRSLLDPVGIGLFLALVIPWHVWVWSVQGWGFFEGFYGGHNVGRFTQTFESHGGHWAYYLLLLPFLLLPFTGLLVNVFRAGRQLWTDPDQRYLLLWCGSVLLLFSFSATQLPHYALYGLPGLLVLLAVHRGEAGSAWLLVPAFTLVALLASVPLLVPLLGDGVGSERDRALLDTAIRARGATLVLAGAATLAALALLARRARGWDRLAWSAVLCTAFVNGAVLPFVAAGQQVPVLEAAAAAHDEPVVRYGIQVPSFSVARDAITPAGLPPPGGLVLTRMDRLGDLEQELPGAHLELVHGSGTIRLLRRLP
jgi:4-amino-4-deoxy-L-arabinose transferase-like glycosyltransferase